MMKRTRHTTKQPTSQANGIMGYLIEYKYYIIIVLLAFIQFANTLNHEYAWDDKIVILENPHVKKGILGIPALFVKGHSDYLHDKNGYRPITQMTFALEQEFFGQNPKVGHLLNILFFCALCVLIYFVLVRLFFPQDHMLAFLITLLYVTHPLHVEVVANIKSRDEIFQLAFSLLTLYQFDRYYTTKRVKHLLQMVLFFFLGYLSRENAITILGIIPCYLLLHKSGDWRQKLRFLSPFPVLIGMAVLIFWLAFRSNVGVELTEGLDIFYEHPVIGNSFALLDVVGERFSNSLVLYFRYIKNFLWPFDLVHFYGFNQIPMVKGFHWIFPLCLVSHLAVFYWLFRKGRQYSVLAVGIVFFYIGLSPFTHILYIMPDTMADRYMFGPSLGLAIAGICLLQFFLSKNWLAKNKRQQKKILYGIAGLFITIGFITTWQRNKAWENDYTLIAADIDKLENCSKAQEQYADMLFLEYNQNGDKSLIPEIVKRYERSIDISEHAYYAMLKLGSNYASFGNAQKGINVLKKMVALFPNQSDPHFYLGSAYYHQKKAEEAKEEFLISKKLSPKNEDSYYLLSACYLELNQLDEAKVECLAAISLFPQTVLVRDVLSEVYYRLGEEEESIAQLQKTVELQSQNPLFHKKLIGRLQQLERHEEAAKAYQRAVSLGHTMSN